MNVYANCKVQFMDVREKETTRQAASRLRATPEGAALLELIHQYDNQRIMAEDLGLNKQLITNWKTKGRISRDGALFVSQKTGIPREKLRPDITDWNQQESGRKVGKHPDRSGKDQVIIEQLCQHFGGIDAFAEKLSVNRRLIHTWSNRGVIPNNRIVAILRMDIPESIRAELTS